LPDESNRVLVECRKMVAANKMRMAFEPTKFSDQLVPTGNLGL
jgi:hypothetical protein